MAVDQPKHFTLGPQHPHFDNPYSTSFVEFVRGRLHKEAEAFPTYVYSLGRAKWEHKNLAQRVIVECLIQGFPQRLNDPVVDETWPHVSCSINADRTMGRLEVSWCPETDALRGGIEIDAIDFKIKAAPPHAGKRILSGILNAFKGKPVVDPADNLPPVGKPDKDLQLTRVIDHDAKANPKSPQVQKPLQSQARQPANSGGQVKPSVARTEPNSKAKPRL